MPLLLKSYLARRLESESPDWLQNALQALLERAGKLYTVGSLPADVLEVRVVIWAQIDTSLSSGHTGRSR